MRRTITLLPVEVDAAYNLSVVAAVLLIDVRPRAEFEAEHAISAVSVAAELFETKFECTAADLDTFVCERLSRQDQGAWRQRRERVVVYDYQSETAESFVNSSQCAATIVNLFASDPRCQQLGFLRGGLVSLRARFPAFVGSNVISPSPLTFPSEIMPSFLYLGGAASRARVESMGITHVLTLGHDAETLAQALLGSAEQQQQAFTHLVLDIDDSPTADLQSIIGPAVDFIATAKRDGGRLLVHCALGVSRSSAIVVAFLMLSENIPFHQSLAFVHARRPTVFPNPGFVNDLRNLQHILGIA